MKILHITIFFLICLISKAQQPKQPLPEHPRPDLERQLWLNLNGYWDFRFDPDDIGEDKKWYKTKDYTHKILVPFPWGSELSEVKDIGDIGWYQKDILIPEEWKGKRIFIVFGASDWHNSLWFDDKKLGVYQGGYTPFEFELTDFIQWGKSQNITLRVDDRPHDFKLEGKQGYGQAKGIWQTVYLEARGNNYMEFVHFTPDIDNSTVTINGELSKTAQPGGRIEVIFPNNEIDRSQIIEIKTGQSQFSETINIPGQILWSLKNPYLYHVHIKLKQDKSDMDVVKSYFGMRKISITNLPGTDYPYIALNNKPIYLKMALDQSYHPKGFYTFPSDDFMRDEILRSKKIGLNGNRIHIKLEIPRKLYWADKLGLLIMEDVPNFWGEPVPQAREEWKKAMEGMIKRDYNHPSVFSWVLFNETWGLFSQDDNNQRVYADSTREWVIRMFKKAKKLDPYRVIEDNSPCNNDHVITDINTWHAYLPGYLWKEKINDIANKTFPGSSWNFVEGFKQANQPNFNSECGNVWGYKGSTGDVDWSWDYHIMMNAFRSNHKICGWLYTEHHDVINEWNGYYKYDRSEKITGIDAIVPGMKLNDLHADCYVSPQVGLCEQLNPGDTMTIPLIVSFLTEKSPGDEVILTTDFYGWDEFGQYDQYKHSSYNIPYQKWETTIQKRISVQMPEKQCLAILAFTLSDKTGAVLHKNFTSFYVKDEQSTNFEFREENSDKYLISRFGPLEFFDCQWSLKQWDVLNGKKVNGAGHGYFHYRMMWPEKFKASDIASVRLLFEASAKQLFDKDKEGENYVNGDYMRGSGAHSPHLNPNAYPMTDHNMFPSLIRVHVCGYPAGDFILKDDPADHRGILSWFSQPKDRTLHEAGSYGYLISVDVPPEKLESAQESGYIDIVIEADESLDGGLALYGKEFGRYPLDPTLMFLLKE